MGANPLVDQLIGLIGQTHWPSTQRTDARARQIYERGLDTVNSFQGNPQVYVEALQAFGATQSCAYAYSGIAFTLVMSTSQTGEGLYRPGMDEAMKWLEKAQEWEPNRVEINFIEAVLYINSGEMDNGRLILDFLGGQEPENYYLCLTEMNYWQQQQNMDEFVRWLQAAIKASDNQVRQAYTLSALGELYLHQGQSEQAIKVFRDVVKLKPDDPWAWHNMSILFLRLKMPKEAEMCNQQALGIADFAAAREIQKAIKQSRRGLGHLF